MPRVRCAGVARRAYSAAQAHAEMGARVQAACVRVCRGEMVGVVWNGVFPVCSGKCLPGESYMIRERGEVLEC